MNNVVHTNICGTREKLWQRIQNAANKIRTTPGVFERLRVSFRHHSDACVHAHGANFEHLLQDLRQVNPPSIKHFVFQRCWNIMPLDVYPL
jgi:RecJ-like exonuclease